MRTSTSSSSLDSSRTSTNGISPSGGDDSNVDQKRIVGKGQEADKQTTNIPRLRSDVSSGKNEIRKTQQAEWNSDLDKMRGNLAKIDAYCDAVEKLIKELNQYLKNTGNISEDNESSSDNDSSTENLDSDSLHNTSSEDADDDSIKNKNKNKNSNGSDSKRNDSSTVKVSLDFFKKNILEMRREGEVIITEATKKFNKAESLTDNLRRFLENKGDKTSKDIISKGVAKINSIFNTENESNLSSSFPEVRERSSPSPLRSTQENKNNISAPKRDLRILENLINGGVENNKMVGKKPESIFEENGNTQDKKATDDMLDNLEELLRELGKDAENSVSGTGSEDNSSSDIILQTQDGEFNSETDYESFVDSPSEGENSAEDKNLNPDKIANAINKE